jgi:DNA-binding transcriptional regulator YdaS (Cro superfamily)
MPPLHQRLAGILHDAVESRGGVAALARELGINPSQLSHLLHARRFVSVEQALAIERVLGASARELLIEACVARVDEALARRKKE